jgi:hypothetical protein
VKKSAFLLLFCAFSLSVMAQTNTGNSAEIGVATGWERYTENNTERYGATFTNNNSFPVIVDAELWVHWIASVSNVHSYINNTTSFLLNPGEKYVWKLGATSYSEVSGFRSAETSNGCYIKYKAIKKQ